jgi:hypothetical protein
MLLAVNERNKQQISEKTINWLLRATKGIPWDEVNTSSPQKERKFF